MQSSGLMAGAKPTQVLNTVSVSKDVPAPSDLAGVYSRLVSQRDELASLRGQADAFISRAKGSMLPATVNLDAPTPAWGEGGLLGSIEQELDLIAGLTADLRDRMIFIEGIA